MNTLPIEIQTKIMKIYWKGKFKEICIDNFHELTQELEKIKFFLNKHFFSCNSDSYLLQIKHYLIKYNNYLKMIKNNKGLIMYLSKINNKFFHIYDNYYDFIANKINKDYKYIMKFAITFGIPYMDYQILQNFYKLDNKKYGIK